MWKSDLIAFKKGRIVQQFIDELECLDRVISQQVQISDDMILSIPDEYETMLGWTALHLSSFNPEQLTDVLFNAIETIETFEHERNIV